MARKPKKPVVKDPLDRLLGRSAVLKTEDAADYQQLYSACAETIKPRNFFEQLEARNRAEDALEAARLRRYKPALLDYYIAEMTEHFRQFLAGLVTNDPDEIAAMAYAKHIDTFEKFDRRIATIDAIRIVSLEHIDERRKNGQAAEPKLIPSCEPQAEESTDEIKPAEDSDESS